MEKIRNIQTLCSVEVAEMVGKNHKNLMRDIRQYITYLGQLNFEPTEFFLESVYFNSQNKEQPCYMITKKGCDMIAHKLTGEKGIEFTAFYVEKFHTMEKYIGKKMTSMQMLELQYQAMREIDDKVDDIADDLRNFKQDMPLFNVDCEELQRKVRKVAIKVLGGYGSRAYADRSIRSKVYKDIQSELKREFDVFSYKAILRSQLGIALGILDGYEPPMVLKKVIQEVNNSA